MFDPKRHDKYNGHPGLWGLFYLGIAGLLTYSLYKDAKKLTRTDQSPQERQSSLIALGFFIVLTILAVPLHISKYGSIDGPLLTSISIATVVMLFFWIRLFLNGRTDRETIASPPRDNPRMPIYDSPEPLASTCPAEFQNPVWRPPQGGLMFSPTCNTEYVPGSLMDVLNEHKVPPDPLTDDLKVVEDDDRTPDPIKLDADVLAVRDNNTNRWRKVRK